MASLFLWCVIVLVTGSCQCAILDAPERKAMGYFDRLLKARILKDDLNGDYSAYETLRDSKAEEASPTTTVPMTPPSTAITTKGCSDRSDYCESLVMKHFGDPNCQQYETKMNCRKTCNICDCSDEDLYLWEYNCDYSPQCGSCRKGCYDKENGCRSYMCNWLSSKTNCQKTCNFCNDGCYDKKANCEPFACSTMYMKENCRAACQLC